MPKSLLITKLRPPPNRSQYLARVQLLENLDAASKLKLTLLSAPAGYGKTTLLTTWLARAQPTVAWLSLDEADNTIRRFLRHLTTALQQVDDTLSALGDFVNEDTEEVLTTILNDFCHNQEDIVLILEDYHLISSPAVHQAVRFLIENAPDRFHLMLSTRSEPPLPLARLRARGDLTEIRTPNLRFTPDEVRAALEVLGLELSLRDSEELTRRTEGWPAGLHLAALSLQGRKDVGDFIERFTGTDRFILDYLTEEVLMRLDADIQDFLLMTSVLERFSAELANAVSTRQDAASVLEHLEIHNLFLVPLDNQRHWYRYHALFQDLLRHRLEDARPDLCPTLHARASDWFERQGDRVNALRHALEAHDYRRAARLAGQHPDVDVIRRHLLTSLKIEEQGQELAALLEQAASEGLSLEQRSQLLETLEDTQDPAVDYGWLETLSERELEVLKLVAAGLSNKQIARRLDISLNTVKTHTRNTYGKLNVTSRTQAVAVAQKLGLL